MAGRNTPYIGGEWISSDGLDQMAVTNPADGEIVGKFAKGKQSHVRRAIESAHAAFPAWSGRTARSRARMLSAAAVRLREHADDLAVAVTRENGKPLAESRGEVEGAAAHFEWFAEEGCRAYGRIVPPAAEGKRHLVIRVPVGVAGCIAPWNFPLVLWARKVAPALAAGCTVVSRGASQTTLCTMQALDCIADLFPPGVLNLVTGDAREVSAELLSNPMCRKISFTGSTAAGRELLRGGADSIAHLSLELGGHAPAIVFPDADPQQAVAGIMGAKFRNGGQSCIAVNRVYLHRDIAADMTRLLATQTAALRVGNGLEEGVDVGPLIDPGSVDNFMQHVENAVSRGAHVECGGDRPTGASYDKGNFVTPTVLSGVADDMLCMCDETFGPLLPITIFDTLDEVLTRANNSPYGLAAYVFTSSLETAFLVGERLEAGTIGINDAVPSTTIAPFGGVKQSGIGRECGAEGLEAFLETKHLSIKL
jgi:succinate-semialdehyde dehydrogenase / glutarate-semialdehyde dehydrogenase